MLESSKALEALTSDFTGELADATTKAIVGAKFLASERKGNTSQEIAVDGAEEWTLAFDSASRKETFKALTELSQLDNEIAKADSIGNSVRSLVSSSNGIRVGFTELSSRPTDEKVKDVQALLYSYGMDLKRLAAGAAADPFFASLFPSAETDLKNLDARAVGLATNSKNKASEFAEAASQIDKTWDLLTAFAKSQRQSAVEEGRYSNGVSLITAICGVAVALLAGVLLIYALKGPIRQITNSMRRLSEGDLQSDVRGENRRDEIGDMARALVIFKQNAHAKIELEDEAKSQRLATEAERSKTESERRTAHERVQHAVEALATALENLAQGRLGISIDRPFTPELDGLRLNFNDSIAALRETLMQIQQIADTVGENGNGISSAVADLSRRTEQQAAAIEETAAAVEQITVTVRTSSDRAGEAKRIVNLARSRADGSAAVVKNAVAAMDRIRSSSTKIKDIVGTIDAIAFQTNLLALNAGVEAARAGESGKGFAVVAHEVRELAQRSATAAREISNLVSRSVDEVETGSRHVEETGTTLMEISSQIVDVASHVGLIADANREQSASLQAISSSINEIDETTQRNSAMVEETHVSAQALAKEARHLSELLGDFDLNRTHPATGNYLMAS